jgi:hypothetical protein
MTTMATTTKPTRTLETMKAYGWHGPEAGEPQLEETPIPDLVLVRF